VSASIDGRNRSGMRGCAPSAIVWRPTASLSRTGGIVRSLASCTRAIGQSRARRRAASFLRGLLRPDCCDALDADADTDVDAETSVPAVPDNSVVSLSA